jgi:hypothetical protein
LAFPKFEALFRLLLEKAQNPSLICENPKTKELLIKHSLPMLLFVKHAGLDPAYFDSQDIQWI